MEKTEKSSLTGLETAYPLEEIRKPRPISSCLIFILASIGVVSLGFMTAYAVLSMESTPPTVAEEINYQEPVATHFLPRAGEGHIRPISQDELHRMMYPMDQPISGDSSPSLTHSLTIDINKKIGSPDIDGMHSVIRDMISSLDSIMGGILSSSPPLRRSEGPRNQERFTSSPFGIDPFFDSVTPQTSSESSDPILKMFSDISRSAPSPPKTFKITLFKKPEQDEKRESPIEDQLRSLLQRHEMERVQSPPSSVRMFHILSPGSLFGPGSADLDSKSEDEGPLFRSPFMNGFPSIFRQLPSIFSPLSASSEEEESPEACHTKDKPETAPATSSTSSPEMKPMEKPTTDDKPSEKVIPRLSTEPIAVNPSATEEEKKTEEVKSSPKGENAPTSEKTEEIQAKKIVKRDTDSHPVVEQTGEQTDGLRHVPFVVQV